MLTLDLGMFWPLILAADLTGSLDLSDRSEARLRTTEGSPTAYDVTTLPAVRAEAHDRRVSYTGAYAVALTLPDLELGVTPQAFQMGSLGVAWHDRTSTLALVEDASYGEQNFSYLSPAQPAPGPAPSVQLLPAAQTLLFGSTRTVATALVSPSARWRFSAGLVYSLGGGADSGSQTVLPLQASERADMSLARDLSRRDVLTSSAWAAQTTASAAPCLVFPIQGASGTPPPICSPRDYQVEATEGWSHRFSTITLLKLSAGAQPVWSRLREEDPFSSRVYPVATLRLESVEPPHAEGGHSVSVDARLAPVVDIRYGTIDERAQLVATASVVHERTTYTLQASGTQSLDPEILGAASYVFGGAEVRYAFSRSLEISAGARAAWQKQVPFGAFFSTIEFVALTASVASKL